MNSLQIHHCVLGLLLLELCNPEKNTQLHYMSSTTEFRYHEVRIIPLLYFFLLKPFFFSINRNACKLYFISNSNFDFSSRDNPEHNRLLYKFENDQKILVELGVADMRKLLLKSLERLQKMRSNSAQDLSSL